MSEEAKQRTREELDHQLRSMHAKARLTFEQQLNANEAARRVETKIGPDLVRSEAAVAYAISRIRSGEHPEDVLCRVVEHQARMSKAVLESLSYAAMHAPMRFEVPVQPLPKEGAPK